MATETKMLNKRKLDTFKVCMDVVNNERLHTLAYLNEVLKHLIMVKREADGPPPTPEQLADWESKGIDTSLVLSAHRYTESRYAEPMEVISLNEKILNGLIPLDSLPEAIDSTEYLINSNLPVPERWNENLDNVYKATKRSNIEYNWQ